MSIFIVIAAISSMYLLSILGTTQNAEKGTNIAGLMGIFSMATVLVIHSIAMARVRKEHILQQTTADEESWRLSELSTAELEDGMFAATLL